MSIAYIKLAFNSLIWNNSNFLINRRARAGVEKDKLRRFFRFFAQRLFSVFKGCNALSPSKTLGKVAGGRKTQQPDDPQSFSGWQRQPPLPSLFYFQSTDVYIPILMKERRGIEAMKKHKGRSAFLFACVAPAVILFTIFMIVPTINVFRMSLYERSAFSTKETFVGWKMTGKLAGLGLPHGSPCPVSETELLLRRCHRSAVRRAL